MPRSLISPPLGEGASSPTITTVPVSKPFISSTFANNKREFYSSLTLTKMHTSATSSLPVTTTQTFAIGDTVAVVVEEDLFVSHYESTTDKPTSTDTTEVSPVTGYFLDDLDNKVGRECWEPAEIVAIFTTQPIKPKKSQAKSSSKKRPLEELSAPSEHGTFLEVRWFYHPSDIKHPPASTLPPPSTPRLAPPYSFSPIFETDHVDVIPSESIISHLTILPNSLPTPYIIDQTTPTFSSTAFYSISRSDRIAVKNDKVARAKRGRIYSKVLKDIIVRDAANTLADNNNTLTGAKQASAAQTSSQFPPNPKTQALSSAINLLALSSSNTSTAPKHLSERASERTSIRTFLESAIKSKGSSTSALFIAGPPGSGKTASVNHVLTELALERSKGKLNDFKTVSVNGMELRHPYEAYTRLLEGMGVEERSQQPGAAAGILEKYFSQAPTGKKDEKTVTVLLLDEMDYLVTQKQTVLYNLFDWPTRNSIHGLVVIGIANTINLPERLLPRVQSRLGLLRLTFKAYTVDQMVSILKTRLSQTACFESGALEFAARKTVGLSGDVRRAFQVCQEAAKNVMEGVTDATTKTSVTVRDVVNAVKAMTDVPQLQSLRMCTDLEALLIVSLSAMLASTGREEGGIGVAELRTKMSGSAAALGDSRYLPVPSWAELLLMVNRLNESRILILETPKTTTMRATAAGSSAVWPMIKLNVDVFDIRDVMVNTDHARLAEKFLRAT